MTPREIAYYQEWKLRCLARRVVARSPYFRQLYEGRDLSRPFELPKTDKQEMMRHLSGYNTAGLDGRELIDFCVKMEYNRDFLRRFGEYTVGMSSGTSGAKGVIILSETEKRFYSCIVAARHGIPADVQPLRVLFFLRVNSLAFEEFNRVGIRLRYVDMMTPLPEVLRIIEAEQPTVLAAHPSLLLTLAETARSGRLPARPRCLISFAEVLEREVRGRLEASFDAPVLEVYQASEGFIGSTCSAGRLHINEDLVLVQTEPVPGYPVAEDGLEPGRVVLSDLHRFTQPILRYELNDLIFIDPVPCPCGSSFRVIRRILGRSDDVFVLPAAGGGYRRVFPDYVSRAVIRAAEGIRRYQVKQTAFDRVTVRLEPEPGASFPALAKAVAASLEIMFRKYECTVPALEVAEGPPEPDGASLKLRRIRRSFDAGTESGL